MNQKYAAIIMKKVPLKDGDFLFLCDHVTLGDYHQENMIFTDYKESHYLSMMSPSVLKSKDRYYYYYLLDLDEYRQNYSITDEESLRAFLEDFYCLADKKFFFLGKDSNGKYSFATFERDKIYGENPHQAIHNNSYRYGDHYQLDLEIQQLQGEVYDEKYTLDELSVLVDRLEESEKDLQSLIKIVRNYAGRELYPYLENNPVPALEKIDIDDVFSKVTRTLIAQDGPAKRVITEIARKEMDARKKREGILLTGPTGIGKTELMRLIAKNINRPFLKVDSTQLTMPGYVGKDIEEVLWDLYVKCGEDIEKTEQAIIFFDEIDKKGSSDKSDPSGKGVLNVLLPFIEGTTYDACSNTQFALSKVKIRTDNMIVILGGAYTDVYQNVQKKDFGFLKENSLEKNLSTKSFIDFGLMPDEFMGRVTVIPLNPLDVEAIKRIMLESDESAIRSQQSIFEKLGVRLTFTDDYTTAVAEDAYAKKTGARGLNGIIDESTWRVFEEVYSHPDFYEEAIINQETLENPDHYQLIKRFK